jgi:CRP-like cAMP-binding protein
MPAGLFSNRIHDAVGLLPTDRELLRALRMSERALEKREPLRQTGDTATRCAIVHAGFLASYKSTLERDQILAFHIPGDFLDLQTLHLPVLEHSIISIGSSRVGLISHSDLKDLLAASPNLAGIFWRETIIEATALRDWICNVGARDALGGVAHLICEVAHRLDAVGLVTEGSFHLPLTQQDIANACGISVVHVKQNAARPAETRPDQLDEPNYDTPGPARTRARCGFRTPLSASAVHVGWPRGGQYRL